MKKQSQVDQKTTQTKYTQKLKQSYVAVKKIRISNKTEPDRVGLEKWFRIFQIPFNNAQS